MLTFDDPAAIGEWAAAERAAGRTLALVPTMGALHAGHMALIEQARLLADTVVVSIFVNPLQFDRADDFDHYPRPIDDDIATCESAGVAAVYAPTAATMYPPGFQTHVDPGQLAAPLEGATRPGHFRGVTTVVAKLFGAVRPDVAVFGQKDYQQLAVVRRMVVDLDIGLRVVGIPTVREHDGLALSSRNRRLPAAARAAAVCIPRALDAAAAVYARGAFSGAELVAAATAVVSAEPQADLDYVAVVDPDSFESLDGESLDGAGAVLVAIAVWFGDVRLIDNRLLGDR